MYLEFDLSQSIASDGSWTWGQSREYLQVKANACRQEVHARRDPLGVIPAYYTWDGTRLRIATSLAELLAAHAGALTMNRVYLESLFHEYYALVEQSPFREVHRLPPGHELVARAGNLSVRRWFEPSINLVEFSYRELRHALYQACEHRASGASRVGVLLSSGLDSTALCYLLQRLAIARKFALHSYTLHFEDGVASAGSALRSALARADWWIRGLPFRPDSCLYQVDREGGRSGSNSSAASYEMYSPNLRLFAPLLEAAADEGVRVVLSGLGGDDLFSPSEQIYSAFFQSGDWLSLWRHRRRFSARALLASAAPLSVYRRLHLHSLARSTRLQLLPSEAEILRARMRGDYESWRQWPLWPHQRNLFAKAFYSGMFTFAMEQEQELAQSFGCRMSYPLLDEKLVQLALAAPLSEFQTEPHNKPVLRAALLGIVPEEIRHRRSTQDYSLVADKIMAVQENEWRTRLNWLVENEIIGPVDFAALNADDVLKLNYVFTIAQITRGGMWRTPRTQERVPTGNRSSRNMAPFVTSPRP